MLPDAIHGAPRAATGAGERFATRAAARLVPPGRAGRKLIPAGGCPRHVGWFRSVAARPGRPCCLMLWIRRPRAQPVMKRPACALAVLTRARRHESEPLPPAAPAIMESGNTES